MIQEKFFLHRDLAHSKERSLCFCDGFSVVYLCDEFSVTVVRRGSREMGRRNSILNLHVVDSNSPGTGFRHIILLRTNNHLVLFA